MPIPSSKGGDRHDRHDRHSSKNYKTLVVTHPISRTSRFVSRPSIRDAKRDANVSRERRDPSRLNGPIHWTFFLRLLRRDGRDARILRLPEGCIRRVW